MYSIFRGLHIVSSLPYRQGQIQSNRIYPPSKNLDQPLITFTLFRLVIPVSEPLDAFPPKHFPNQNLYVALYLLVTITPLFVASLKKVKVFGWSLIGSLALSYIFFFHYIVSVWCFFAAILSVQILLIIVYNTKEQKTPFAPLKEW